MNNAVLVTLTQTATGWDVRVTDPGITVLVTLLCIAMILTLAVALRPNK